MKIVFFLPTPHTCLHINNCNISYKSRKKKTNVWENMGAVRICCISSRRYTWFFLIKSGRISFLNGISPMAFKLRYERQFTFFLFCRMNNSKLQEAIRSRSSQWYLSDTTAMFGNFCDQLKKKNNCGFAPKYKLQGQTKIPPLPPQKSRFSRVFEQNIRVSELYMSILHGGCFKSDTLGV